MVNMVLGLPPCKKTNKQTNKQRKRLQLIITFHVIVFSLKLHIQTYNIKQQLQFHQ